METLQVHDARRNARSVGRLFVILLSLFWAASLAELAPTTVQQRI